MKEPSVFVGVKVPAALVRKVDDLAVLTNRTRSEVLRLLMSQAEAACVSDIRIRTQHVQEGQHA